MKRALLPLLCFLVTGPLFALGQGERITVTGTIRLVGNEPFTQYVLVETGEKVWFLPENFKRKHPELTGRQVTLSGIPQTRKKTTADKKRTLVRQWLNDPTLAGDTRED
jgi:hypothetical protein